MSVQVGRCACVWRIWLWGRGRLLCREKRGLYLIVAKFVAIRKVYRLVYVQR